MFNYPPAAPPAINSFGDEVNDVEGRLLGYSE